MSKMSERRFCPSEGGHMFEGDFCPEHGSRIGHRLGKLLLWVGLIVILLLLFNGFWTLCTVTDPEYLDFCASYGC